jgi:hypothetical protein
MTHSEFAVICESHNVELDPLVLVQMTSFNMEVLTQYICSSDKGFVIGYTPPYWANPKGWFNKQHKYRIALQLEPGTPYTAQEVNPLDEEHGKHYFTIKRIL